MTSEGDYYWRAVPVPGTSVRLGNLRQQPIIVEVRLSNLLRTDAIVLKLHTAGRSSSEHPGSSVEDNSDRSAAP